MSPVKRRQYLITGEDVPRRTRSRWLRRKRETERERECHDSSEDESQQQQAPVKEVLSRDCGDDWETLEMLPRTSESSSTNESSNDSESSFPTTEDKRDHDSIQASTSALLSEPISESESSECLEEVNNQLFQDRDEVQQLSNQDDDIISEVDQVGFDVIDICMDDYFGRMDEVSEEEGNNSPVRGNIFADDCPDFSQGIIPDETNSHENQQGQEDQENQSDQGNKYPLLRTQVCPTSATTEGDVLLMCLALGIRHNLSWVAMVDVLKMVNSLLGFEAVSASKYYLQKYLDAQNYPSTFHFFCSVCETYLGPKNDAQVDGLGGCECSDDPTEINTSYFLSVDFVGQIKDLLKQKHIADEILNYRFNRQKQRADALEDIFDGQCYVDYCTKGEKLLSFPDNFSYTFNTDGVQIGKSSSNAAWPIFLSINELAPHNRKKHMLFAGIWVGRKQPNMNIFLRPFVEDANKLSTEGFDWTDSRGAQHHSRVIPLCCVVDSAARYKLLSMTCYSGYFGCTFCYQKAEHTAKGRRFTIPSKRAPLRTDSAIRADMIKAAHERDNPKKKLRVVNGVKGPSPLALLHFLDLDKGFVVDSMHNSYLGIIKSYTGTLLTSFQRPYYVGSPSKLLVINGRLCNISPPSCITRAPRTIDDWKKWKASEWRSWLLFYALVCLDGELPEKFLAHIALFSEAIFLLLQKSVSLSDVRLANMYLSIFVCKTQEFFGETAMNYNYHLTTHICRGIINYGPLWTHTAFSFEGENRHFMQMNTSPAFISQQLARRYSIFSRLPRLCEMYGSSDNVYEFIDEITGKSVKTFTQSSGCVLLGSGRPFRPDETQSDVLPNLQGAELSEFSRMLYGGFRICTGAYANDKQKDDSYLSIGSEMKVRVENIVLVKKLQSSSVILIVTTFFTEKIQYRFDGKALPFLNDNLVHVSNIKKVIRTGNLFAIKPQDILGQCVYMDIGHARYLADVPYGCFGD